MISTTIRSSIKSKLDKFPFQCRRNVLMLQIPNRSSSESLRTALYSHAPKTRRKKPTKGEGIICSEKQFNLLGEQSILLHEDMIIEERIGKCQHAITKKMR
jgi:hypothetical protein